MDYAYKEFYRWVRTGRWRLIRCGQTKCIVWDKQPDILYYHYNTTPPATNMRAVSCVDDALTMLLNPSIEVLNE